MNDSKKSLLPALFVVGSGLNALPASAIELGEINVQSTLGQPLRASIAYALGPNEQLADYCVTLKPGLQNGGLPAISRADVSVAGGVISLTGRTVIREPLMTVRVDVACPYTPNLSREYMLFIDPAIPVTAAVTTNEAAPSSATQKIDTQQQRPAPRTSTRRTAAVSTPIDMSERYRVQPGDSLSEIAARLQNRPVGLWNAVAQIFDANPDAFIDNDMNKLKAGSWLVIPNFASDNSAAVSAPIVRAPIMDSVADTPSQIDTTSAVDTTVDDTEVLEPVTTPDVADLRPGDLIVDEENPFIANDQTSVVLPETELDAPTTASSPNVPTASIALPDVPTQPATNWLLWLVGGGIALFAGLLFFGRRKREEYEPAPIAPVAPHPMRRNSDSVTVEVLAEPGYELDDDSPTAENLALDADLVVGTGLQEGTDMDVNQDFGFAATTDLDLEFPAEADASETRVTDIIAAPTVEEATILDDEVLPDDEDYDMSVIVDATKMPRPDDATERDLKAIEIESDDEALVEEDYTVSQEVDYHILEQDYEDELTATQALNKEIEKAAAELAKRMDGADNDDETAAMRLATVTELDVTSKLPSDGGEVNELVNADDGVEVTEEMLAEEKTVEMPNSNHDDTVEMPSESSKVDTKVG
ncbi:MAG: LysM peptidoglycan-binding domain-containing protein [Gammaproteobacteria bacterium]|nr:LysM peptidoglycan-binding domain-containing protein [Gammaproteobacteria bacterium]